MKFRAFGTSLLIAESRNDNQIGGIKIASTGHMKSGKVVSIGALALLYDGMELRPEKIEIGDEVVYDARSVVPFEFGDPNMIVIDIDDVVAIASATE
jgi:co-chaperonin GroES (HSP10)